MNTKQKSQIPYNKDNFKYLEELTTEIKNASEIQPEPIPQKEEIPESIKKNSQLFWNKISLELLDSYNFGYNSGKFNSNPNSNIDSVFKDINNMIKEMIRNEYIKNNNGSIDELKSYFDIINNTLLLLSKGINQSKNKHNTKSILAVMHGYINAMIEKKML